MTAVLTGEESPSKQVDQKQTEANWILTIDWPEGMAEADIKAPGTGAADNYWTVQPKSGAAAGVLEAK